ncbi:signal peptidase I [Paenibacillus gansuensis]|uniref:Signal peptidase I n=1 Tax=Paenibacillus gansuensis TaxID=306542 RepID=A0ABW5PJ52_9BACL
MTEQPADVITARSSKPSVKSEVWGWIRFLLIIGAAFLIIHNLAGLTKVSGNSMNPTLQNGNIMLINKLSLLFSEPKYGDVVTIKDERMDFSIIKRVIAVGGDKVAIRGGVVYVNGNPLAELYTLGQSQDMDEVTVDPGHIFVAGDNRSPGASLDSRDPGLGQILTSDVKGYAVVSLWPMHRIAKPLEL